MLGYDSSSSGFRLADSGGATSRKYRLRDVVDSKSTEKVSETFRESSQGHGVQNRVLFLARAYRT